MDKLKRYNQKLLAIIGTTILVIAGISIIFGLGAFVVSLLDFSNADNHGLKVPTETTTINNDSIEFVRTQAITFNSPYKLDTAQSKFLIAVGQVNLKTEEKVRIESGGMSKISSYEYPYESHYGLFNNFIYYNNESGISHKIFDERIAITSWLFLKIDSIEVLLFKGTTTDDNSDGQIDYNDYQSLFAYYLNNQELLRYNFDNKTVLEFEPMNKTNLVSIELGIDKDKDFDFENRSEPKEITSLNVRTRKIQPIVIDEIKHDIQKIVDGVKN